MTTITNTTETSPATRPNKYIYDEFAGRAGEKLLFSILPYLMPRSVMQTILVMLKHLEPGNKIYISIERIASERGVCARKIEIDIKWLIDHNLLDKYVGPTRRPVGDGTFITKLATIKDISKLLAQARLYHEWSNDPQFIPARREEVECIRKLPPKELKIALTFYKYRNILELSRTSKTSNSISEDNKTNYFASNSSLNRNNTNVSITSIENSNSLSISESLLNNSILNFENEGMRTLVHYPQAEQLRCLVQALTRLLANDYENEDHQSYSHQQPSIKIDADDYTSIQHNDQESLQESLNDSYEQEIELSPQFLAEIGAEQPARPEQADRYAVSIGEEPHESIVEQAKAQHQEQAKEARHKRAKVWSSQETTARERYKAALAAKIRRDRLPQYARMEIEKISLQMGDEEIISSIGRVSNFYLQGSMLGITDQDFDEAIKEARQLALAKTNIARKRKDNGMPNRMPYFFTCLETEIRKAIAIRKGKHENNDKRGSTHVDQRQRAYSMELGTGSIRMEQMGKTEAISLGHSTIQHNRINSSETSIQDQCQENDEAEAIQEARGSSDMIKDEQHYRPEPPAYEPEPRTIVRQHNRTIANGQKIIDQDNYTPEIPGALETYQRNRVDVDPAYKRREIANEALKSIRKARMIANPIFIGEDCHSCGCNLFYLENGVMRCPQCEPLQIWSGSTRSQLLRILNSIPSVEMIKQESK